MEPVRRNNERGSDADAGLVLDWQRWGPSLSSTDDTCRTQGKRGRYSYRVAIDRLQWTGLTIN